MRWLIIQSAGQNEKNAMLRECYSVGGALVNLKHTVDIWGLRHENEKETPNFELYDAIFIIENYEFEWLPDFTKIKKPLKFHWIIDLHCRGMGVYVPISKGCDVILHSTKALIPFYQTLVPTATHLWFPNAIDDRYFNPMPKHIKRQYNHQVLFIANPLNRLDYIKGLSSLQHLGFVHKQNVVGQEMVTESRLAQILFNRSIGCDVNYRNFEAVGLGNCLITNYNKELEELGFCDGNNCFFYSTYGECVDKLSVKLLQRGYWQDVQKNAAKLGKRHTYTKRLEKTLRKLSPLIDKHKKDGVVDVMKFHYQFPPTEKRVITFSLWGDNPKYTHGAVINARLLSQIYPGWEAWFYVGKSVPRNIVNEIQKIANCKVIEMDEAGDWTGMFWRFGAIFEPDVDVMISRDTDSRLSHREAIAVIDWLKSDKGFHIMRDHPWHTTKILGGMWGCRTGVLSDDIKDKMQTYDKRGDYWQTDQNFLSDVVYSQIKNDVVIHDDGFYKVEGEKPEFFPLSRINFEYVGEPYSHSQERFQEGLNEMATYEMGNPKREYE